MDVIQRCVPLQLMAQHADIADHRNNDVLRILYSGDSLVSARYSLPQTPGLVDPGHRIYGDDSGVRVSTSQTNVDDVRARYERGRRI